jgi:hypothetical protein
LLVTGFGRGFHRREAEEICQGGQMGQISHIGHIGQVSQKLTEKKRDQFVKIVYDSQTGEHRVKPNRFYMGSLCILTAQVFIVFYNDF